MKTNKNMNPSGLGLQNVEPWTEPVSGSELLEELLQVLKRYVVLPSMGPETLALWTLHTYAFELRDVSTYIGLGSPQKRCGKTTLLGVMTELASRPLVASNISPPALFRAIEEERPTLLIDEADTFLQGNDELRGILNSGYTRKTAYVVRVTGETRNSESGTRNEEGSPEGGTTNGSTACRPTSLRRFSCWCPKVIAAIGKLPETLRDRCITITMQRKMADERCERLRSLNGEVLRRKCARFVRDHREVIMAAQPEMPKELNDRAADIWEPLLALADIAGGVWPDRARQAALKLSGGVQETTPIGSLLLDILFGFIQLNKERLFSRTLVDWLNDMGDRPWTEGRKGREIDEVWLAQQLRPYGVRPKTMWIEGKAAKGYLKADFEEVWPRYVSRSDFEAFMAEQEPPKEDQGTDARADNRAPGLAEQPESQQANQK